MVITIEDNVTKTLFNIFNFSIFPLYPCTAPGPDYDADDICKHKSSDYYSPSRDPAAMRNHYEGLLEGAIQMYSSQDDLPMPLPNRDFTNHRKPTKRELRGSSAGASK